MENQFSIAFLYQLFGQLAHVNPFQRIGVLVKLVKIELYGAACAADGRKDRFKTFEADIKINWYALIYAKWAYTADRMANKLKNLIR